MNETTGYECAFVRPEKITCYLLSEKHPAGRHKAMFFSQFGFTLVFWRQLEIALLGHAAQHEVTHRKVTPFGCVYVIDGPLQTPDGRTPFIRTI